MAVWIAHRPGGPRTDRYFLQGRTIGRDHFVALDFLMGQRSDPQAPIAWHGSVLFDGRAPIEFTGAAAGGTITTDALAIIEWVTQQAADTPAAAESGTTARSNTLNQVEASACAVDDASAQIGTLGQAAAVVDAFLRVEAGCELNTANILTCENLNPSTSASFAALNSWVTPLIQIALGRMLKSPGKLRILIRWKQ